MKRVSHTCPECDELCRCRGDIDDCMIDTDETMKHCEHWRQCDPDYSEEDEFDDRDGTDEDP